MAEAPVSVNGSRVKVAAARILSTLLRTLLWMPPKARLAICAGSLVLFGLATYAFLTGNTANLNLVCRHNFQTADLSVFVDDNLIVSDQTLGTVKRRFGILDKKVEGAFSKALAVPLGKHVIRVRLQSAAERFDQTRQIGVNLVSGKVATVVVTAQRGDLALSYEGPPMTPSTRSDSDYGLPIRSILVTVMGSVASAVIGFIIQEFLKSKKAALTRNQPSKPLP